MQFNPNLHHFDSAHGIQTSTTLCVVWSGKCLNYHELHGALRV